MTSIWMTDVAGRKVSDLLSHHEPAGEHTVDWDCTDHNGMRLPNGVYFLNLRTEHHTVTRRLVVSR
jgi:flagellar hook assembly protein FlgD